MFLRLNEVDKFAVACDVPSFDEHPTTRVKTTLEVGELKFFNGHDDFL